MELWEYADDIYRYVSRNLFCYENSLKEGDIDPWKSILRFYVSIRELQKIEEKRFSDKSYVIWQKSLSTF